MKHIVHDVGNSLLVGYMVPGTAVLSVTDEFLPEARIAAYVTAKQRTEATTTRDAAPKRMPSGFYENEGHAMY